MTDARLTTHHCNQSRTVKLCRPTHGKQQLTLSLLTKLRQLYYCLDYSTGLWSFMSTVTAVLCRASTGRQINKQLPPQPLCDPLSGTTRLSRYQKDKPFWILLKQTWWGGIVAVASAERYTSYLHFAPEDNQASTSSGRFLRIGCPSWHPTNSVKALKAKHWRPVKSGKMLHKCSTDCTWRGLQRANALRVI